MAKYLIVNADDYGMCHAANEAVAELLRANGAEVVVVSGNGETEEYKERFLNRRVIIKVYEE